MEPSTHLDLLQPGHRVHESKLKHFVQLLLDLVTKVINTVLQKILLLQEHSNFVKVGIGPRVGLDQHLLLQTSLWRNVTLQYQEYTSKAGGEMEVFIRASVSVY